MTDFLLYYGLAIVGVGILTTFYGIDVYVKERKKWADLKSTMKCFVLSAACFSIAGIFLGILYTSNVHHTHLQVAPQLFYILGFIFLLIGGKNFKKFSRALHSERDKLKKD